MLGLNSFDKNSKITRSFAKLLLQALLLFSFFVAKSANSTNIKAETVFLDIQVQGKLLRIETLLYKPSKPNGSLFVFFHGEPFSKSERLKIQPYHNFSLEFARRGYTVAIPMRQGFARSSGLEANYSCESIDSFVVRNEYVLISSIQRLSRLLGVEQKDVILGGQSAGGFLALYIASRALDLGVRFRGIVAFAPGITYQLSTCGDPRAYLKYLRKFLANSTIHSLLLFAINDDYFPYSDVEPHLKNRSLPRHVSIVTVGTLVGNAHMFVECGGVSLWMPHVRRFMISIGMPWDVLGDVLAWNGVNVPKRSAYVAGDSILRLGLLTDLKSGRTWNQYMQSSCPRAVAADQAGNLFVSTDLENPILAALQRCRKTSNETCSLFSFDHLVLK